MICGTVGVGVSTLGGCVRLLLRTIKRGCFGQHTFAPRSKRSKSDSEGRALFGKRLLRALVMGWRDRRKRPLKQFAFVFSKAKLRVRWPLYTLGGIRSIVGKKGLGVAGGNNLAG